MISRTQPRVCLCSSRSMHPRSWKGLAANFASTGFSEVRLAPVRSGGALRLAQDVGRVVAMAPVLHDLTVHDAKDVDRSHLHPVSCGGYTLELPLVGPTHGHAGGHLVSLRDHVFDLDARVREGGMSFGSELSEGIDKLRLGEVMTGGAFVVVRLGIDDIFDSGVVPRGDKFVDSPRYGLILVRHSASTFFPATCYRSRHLSQTYAELALRLRSHCLFCCF